MNPRSNIWRSAMSVAISEISGGCLSPAARFLIVSLFLTTCARAQSPVPNTPQGFQQQYHPAFEAYQRHDNAGLEKRLDTYAIPAPWFSQTFGPDRGPGLATRYASEFSISSNAPPVISPASTP
jgi:hypothetical protein